MDIDSRELRILARTRTEMDYSQPLFVTEKLPDLILQARNLCDSYRKTYGSQLNELHLVSCAIIHIAYQTVLSHFLKTTDINYFQRFALLSQKNPDIRQILEFFRKEYPEVRRTPMFDFMTMDEQTRCFFIHQVIDSNPAMKKELGLLYSSEKVQIPKSAKALLALLGGLQDSSVPTARINPEEDIFEFLTAPSRLYPDSLEQQMGYIQTNWRVIIGDDFSHILDKARGILQEGFNPKAAGGGPGPTFVPDFSANMGEYELFSDDKNWMPNVVMMAKNIYVWLDQLSRQYSRPIHNLNEIPDEELDLLKERGFNALWLIGLWERSQASRRIKNLCGNPEAEASAYSIKSYNISNRIGSWGALAELRQRCQSRGIRLASDMVPNHTGIDSDWMKEHSEYFVSQSFKPFPSYTFDGPDLSTDPEIEVKIEDHYYNRTDAAVVFRRIDRRTGETQYIFHGNDGTTMPWNDTAQLDFLNPATREAVIQQIIDVARNFPIIRFDAAMTLARKHIRRLWYPALGTRPDIAGRGIHEMSDEEFDKAIPKEFWREVVDRIAAEVPDTLLLAEAFWMMEGYFVRTLGMHRVYNSAFMNMLKNQENKKYRDSIKSTIEFDPEILKRYVNFMNNPDEEPAIIQFGNGDRYFGVCTLLATMPGLPMFGHGQIEGFSEKYGMEYTRAYWNEEPDAKLIERHRNQIFPLLKRRYLFSNCEYFQLFDAVGDDGTVRDSIFAYTNGTSGSRVLVFYNNQYEKASGWIRESAPKLSRNGDGTRTVVTTHIARALNLPDRKDWFIIARRFNSRFSYLLPAQKVFKDGLHVDLNGYETKIFTDIRVQKDETGILTELYLKYGGQGMIEDFDAALSRTVLAPLFGNIAGLIASDFSRILRKILASGSATETEQGSMAVILLDFYRTVEESCPCLQAVQLSAKAPDAGQIGETVRKLQATYKQRVFLYANQLWNHSFEIHLVFFILQLFTQPDMELKRVLEIADLLGLDSALGISRAEVHLGALICLQGRIPMKTLLKDSSFGALIGANKYQGVVWYKSEAFLDAILAWLTGEAFGASEKTKPEVFEKEFAFWLEKAHNSKYILDNLLTSD